MSKVPLSVHILTWNSAHTLTSALQSVQGCEEILILDGGSTDDTIAIAERFGARVLPQRMPGGQGKPLTDFSAARNVGLEHATQKWILCLDSDEMMDKPAMEEIAEIVRTGPPSAFLVPRHYVLSNHTVIEHASTYPNTRVYFFHRDAVEKWEKPVHERIQVKPGMPVGYLRHGSLAPLPPLSVFYGKLGQYLSIERELARGQGWKQWWLRVLHTLRGRLLATLRIMKIWLLPKKEARLPLSYEWARYWYAWRLLVMTCPLRRETRNQKPETR